MAESVHNYNLFNWLVDYYGIEDRRKGHKPLCLKSAAQAKFFVGHGGAGSYMTTTGESPSIYRGLPTTLKGASKWQTLS